MCNLRMQIMNVRIIPYKFTDILHGKEHDLLSRIIPKKEAERERERERMRVRQTERKEATTMQIKQF